MHETMLQFQAQGESIKNLVTQIDQIVIALSSWEYEESKPIDMSEEDTLEGEIEPHIIVTKDVDLSSPNLQKGGGDLLSCH